MDIFPIRYLRNCSKSSSEVTSITCNERTLHSRIYCNLKPFSCSKPSAVDACYRLMDTIPEASEPRVITGIYCRAIQLRKELAVAADQLSKSELHTDGNQMKAALKSMDDVIAKLEKCRERDPNPLPVPKKQPINTKSLTLSERAVIFQSWERKRKNSEQYRPSVRQLKASNSQL